MESVREWAAAVCCACIVSAMLSMVFPGGSNKKLLGTVLSVMMMCIVFQPIVALRNLASELKDYSFDVMQYRNEELESEVEHGAKSVYSSYLAQNLRRVLDGAEISYQSVEVIMDKSADGCISIGQVEVIVKNEDVDNAKRIKALLRDYIGFEPVVTVCGTEGSE